MNEHRRNRALELIGATSLVHGSPGHGWYYGQNHDYFLSLPSGRVVAEVCQQPDRFNVDSDRLWSVTWVEDFKPGEAAPVQEFYVTRSAARMRVEGKYETTTPLLQS